VGSPIGEIMEIYLEVLKLGIKRIEQCDREI
jgi:hypothetical protein